MKKSEQILNAFKEFKEKTSQTNYAIVKEIKTKNPQSKITAKTLTDWENGSSSPKLDPTIDLIDQHLKRYGHEL